jgi:hypothetical protein
MKHGQEKSDLFVVAMKLAVALYLNRILRSPGNPRFKYSKLLHFNVDYCT